MIKTPFGFEITSNQ